MFRKLRLTIMSQIVVMTHTLGWTVQQDDKQQVGQKGS